MKADDVTATLDLALKASGLDQAKVLPKCFNILVRWSPAQDCGRTSPMVSATTSGGRMKRTGAWAVPRPAEMMR